MVWKNWNSFKHHCFALQNSTPNSVKNVINMKIGRWDQWQNAPHHGQWAPHGQQQKMVKKANNQAAECVRAEAEKHNGKFERDEISSVRQHSPAIDTLIIGHPSQRINNYTAPPKQTSALLATQNCSSISETESVIFSDASIKPIVSSCDDCSACRLLLGGFRRAVCMIAASRSCSHRLTANISLFA